MMYTGTAVTCGGSSMATMMMRKITFAYGIRILASTYAAGTDDSTMNAVAATA